jgi:hypothetical protein
MIAARATSRRRLLRAPTRWLRAIGVIMTGASNHRPDPRCGYAESHRAVMVTAWSSRSRPDYRPKRCLAAALTTAPPHRSGGPPSDRHADHPDMYGRRLVGPERHGRPERRLFCGSCPACGPCCVMSEDRAGKLAGSWSYPRRALVVRQYAEGGRQPGRDRCDGGGGSWAGSTGDADSCRIAR